VRLGSHVEAHQLGGIYGPDTTFQIGENQRIPDVAFVAVTRFPVDGEVVEADVCPTHHEDAVRAVAGGLGAQAVWAVQTAGDRTVDETGRPIGNMPARQLFAISIYWLGINSIWGALNIQTLPPLAERMLGPLYGPLGPASNFIMGEPANLGKSTA
jgi:hypothetical protein